LTDIIIEIKPYLNLIDRGHYYTCCCPYHMENKPSFAIYKQTETFVCFSCGEKGPLKRLYKYLLGQDYKEDINIYYNKEKDKKRKILEQNLLNKKKTFIIEGFLSDVRTDLEAYDYLLKRNFSNVLIEFFKISLAKNCKINETKFYKRLIIPIYENNKLVSYEGKSYTNAVPKVLYPKRSYVSTLFNVDNLDRNKSLIICEGIFDVPLIWRYITKNVTSTFGSNINSNQIKLINEFKNVILFIDDDKAGYKMAKTLDKYLEHDFYLTFIKGKDPGDGSIEEIKLALKNKIFISDYFLKKLGLFQKTVFW